MSSWRCTLCRTTYAVGLAACPQCGETGYSEGGVVMAKASAEGGATQYLAEGQEVPDDLPDGVRLVGPGAPAEDVPEPDEPAEAEAEAEAGPEPPAPASSPAFPGPDDEDGPPDYGSYPVTVLRDLARERGVSYGGLVKADLAAALAQWDTEHPEGD